ncbi:MAG: biopolymer transporter ExbD [Kiritimatiellia bacterium]
MKFSGKLKEAPVGFQIAPMIDVVFLLLIFFVTSQIYAQWESEIDIRLPTAKTAQEEPRMPGEIIVNVSREGVVMVSGQVLDDDRLGTVLKRLVAVFPGQPVLIRADRKTAYEQVVRVLDICRQCDVWNVSFATALTDSESAVP